MNFSMVLNKEIVFFFNFCIPGSTIDGEKNRTSLQSDHCQSLLLFLLNAFAKCFFTISLFSELAHSTKHLAAAAAAAKSLQSCPTLCDPIDGSPPGSLVPGILQERTLEWVAISFSNA